ncbi:hypothetical protein ACFL6C_13985, partial [Myxococcota bacterium]
DAGKVPDSRARKGIRTMQPEIKRTALATRVWRKNHSGPIADMPVELQREVVKLLESHSWDQVSDAIGISKSTLSVFRKRHREHLQLRSRRSSGHRQVASRKRDLSRKKSPERPNGFIEVPVVSSPSRLDVEIRLPSGIVVQASSGSDTGAVGDFVARLLADTQSAT